MAAKKKRGRKKVQSITIRITGGELKYKPKARKKRKARKKSA